ncbi:MAG: hypothetical protein GX573_03660 [Chloroflexi bacterium]|nr:hypothetical protein [Chloroflexota bacterium]
MTREPNEAGRAKNRLSGRLEGVRKRKRARQVYECEFVLEKLRLIEKKERSGR